MAISTKTILALRWKCGKKELKPSKLLTIQRGVLWRHVKLMQLYYFTQLGGKIGHKTFDEGLGMGSISKNYMPNKHHKISLLRFHNYGNLFSHINNFLGLLCQSFKRVVCCNEGRDLDKNLRYFQEPLLPASSHNLRSKWGIPHQGQNKWIGVYDQRQKRNESR